MPELKDIHLFRMVHIENIPHIFEHGITHQTSSNCNPNYQTIGDAGLINKRNTIKTPNGKMLGEYIPFYFGSRMPMLYAIQFGYNGVESILPEKIVYLVSNVQKIIDLDIDFVFTDGHATDGLTTFYEKNKITTLTTDQPKLDFGAIRRKYWIVENDTDFKRRKQAEFLVLGDISYDAVSGFVVYNEAVQKQLQTLSLNREIAIRPQYYF